MLVLTVIGARPQFVKTAPVSRALRGEADEILVHTGQHYDDRLSEIFFDELGIPQPDYHLGVGSGTHAEQTGAMLGKLEQVMAEVGPDWVIVYGDTNTTLAGALAAAKLNLRVAHVEAGQRSLLRTMPEEVNRVVTDHLASLLLCPTPNAVKQLASEGIVEGVVLTGDVMVDALEFVRPLLKRSRATDLLGEGPYYVATAHRAATVDDPQRLVELRDLFGAVPGRVVFPVHPRTSTAMERSGLTWSPNVDAREPFGYADMLTAVRFADAVLTDSGGLQKEAVLLETKCLTLREVTEWPETLEGGWNTLVGLSRQRVMAALRAEPTTEANAILTPGASEKVVAALLTNPGRFPDLVSR